jgi:predicted TIM-barrel fold metal-dependent hydrolase
MANRRQFFRQVAGAAAATYLIHPSAGGEAAQTAPRRAARPIAINGRRVKTIDFHAHCAVPEAAALTKDDPPAPPGPPGSGTHPAAGLSTAVDELRLRHMDEAGIDMQVLNAGASYTVSRPIAERLGTVLNEGLVKICAAHPGRFAPLASITLQYPDLAAAQLDYAVHQLGMRGAAIRTGVNGDELSAARFDPFWAKAEETGALIFIHPGSVPELDKRLVGNGMLTNVIGFPLDTTIALSRLIFEGVLDRFPRLRVGAAHGGGFLTSYADRFDHGCVAFPENCNRTLKKHPTEYLKQMYFDSIVFTPEALRHVVAQVGASQLLLGSDYPYPWMSDADALDLVMATPMSDQDRTAILSGNAIRLLDLPRA